ncbi:MAG: hypothetical protein D9V44_08485 [Actinobacteria bacterium]|nr:MAG: hypothetical protein D9V44_08485 [Actinomycetota bacterium]
MGGVPETRPVAKYRGEYRSGSPRLWLDSRSDCGVSCFRSRLGTRVLVWPPERTRWSPQTCGVGACGRHVPATGCRFRCHGRTHDSCVVARTPVLLPTGLEPHGSIPSRREHQEHLSRKGSSLRCVVIPRLPFGQINDPVLEERKERDRAWWEHYYLPEAILELKQAAGRLIRSSTDEGCLVLADARLTGGKSYAGRFLEALPVRDIERLPSEEVVEEIERRFWR